MKYKITLLLLTLIALFGCQTTNNSKPTVTVSIIPQKFFVDQIAGDWLHVNVMIPPGGSPATYEPTPMQMKNLSKSSVYFQIGHITYEKSWVEKLKSVSPKTKFIDTSEGLNLISEEGWGEEHTDEHGHSHKHTGYNPHIWLSPNLVKKQAEKMYETLGKIYPQHKESMQANLKKFSQQCDSVHLQLDKQLKGAGGTSFIVYHPVWSYLARDYQLNQIAIEHNGKEATADKLKRIIDYANNNNIRVVFVQKEFSDIQARTIANEINGQVAQMNPLDYHWFNTMKEFGEVFQEIHQ